ncbi:alpha/beta hydrolase [Saprospira sp. CCB-QB6]|uniref:alpha/beta hydrolase n=1 Tax=Saprospira sp. CCB-QB6 TaxID=3023936 RepID=UPI00234B130D|nr:alpha/beta hydrolase [Saprospira sp. CCB-QB6]WCL81746.1 alpha/beta hydrolase [Saprospira sp. CCB-QB6]
MQKIERLIVKKTAHYHTLGELNAQTEHIYLAIHGYGQDASRLPQKFRELPNTFVIAPEALSSFYWKASSGQVGHSWMTKNHREDEIQDYLAYLDQLYAHFAPNFPPNAKFHLLGFSQGGATALRWALHRQPERLHKFIIWAADAPPELDYQTDFLAQLQFYWVCGQEDAYFPKERLNTQIDFWKNLPYPPQIKLFDGPHRIDKAVLKRIHEEGN